MERFPKPFIGADSASLPRQQVRTEQAQIRGRGEGARMSGHAEELLCPLVMHGSPGDNAVHFLRRRAVCSRRRIEARMRHAQFLPDLCRGLFQRHSGFLRRDFSQKDESHIAVMHAAAHRVLQREFHHASYPFLTGRAEGIHILILRKACSVSQQLQKRDPLHCFRNLPVFQQIRQRVFQPDDLLFEKADDARPGGCHLRQGRKVKPRLLSHRQFLRFPLGTAVCLVKMHVLSLARQEYRTGNQPFFACFRQDLVHQSVILFHRFSSFLIRALDIPFVCYSLYHSDRMLSTFSAG